jgi:hypothetical protein
MGCGPLFKHLDYAGIKQKQQINPFILMVNSPAHVKKVVDRQGVYGHPPHQRKKKNPD